MKTPHIKIEGTSKFQIGELQNNIVHYDFEKIKTYLNIKGHLIFDKNFRLYKEDELLLFKLCCYYIQDHWACAKMGIDTKNLSRCVEAAGTVGINLVPWSVPVVFAVSMLGVSPGEFIPYAFFAFLVPLINLIFGFTGWTITKKNYAETTIHIKGES